LYFDLALKRCQYENRELNRWHVVFDHRRPNPRATSAWIRIDYSLQAYHGATLMDPEALEVQPPQQRRKRHSCDCAESNEIGHEAFAPERVNAISA
jgi:hypothetical protein